MPWNPQQVRALREHVGMSQTELAEALGFTRYQSVSELERGARDVQPTVARLLDFIADRHGFDVGGTSLAERAGRAATDAEALAARLRQLERDVSEEGGA